MNLVSGLSKSSKLILATEKFERQLHKVGMSAPKYVSSTRTWLENLIRYSNEDFQQLKKSLGDVKYLQGHENIWERRAGDLRIYFTLSKDQQLILLWAGLKNSQKADIKEAAKTLAVLA